MPRVTAPSLPDLDHVALMCAVVLGALAWPAGDVGPLHGVVFATMGVMALGGTLGRGHQAIFLGGAVLMGLLVTQRPTEPALALACFLATGSTWARSEGRFDADLGRGLHPLAAFLGAALVLGPTEVHAGRTAPLVALALLAMHGAWSSPAPHGLTTRMIDLVSTPARFLVASFLALIATGTLLLALPAASADGRSIHLIDAAFTAVSATCVTGLAVLDTPRAFSGFGQLVILGLIQVGGLGIMTFAAFFAVVAGRRLRIDEEAFATELLGGGILRRHLDRALLDVIRVSVITEVGGAAVLSAWFAWRGDPLPTALWRGLFTAISAFCNAGFALQSDSLIGYAHDPVVLGVIGGIIVVGSAGPVAVVALPRVVTGGASVQVRLVWSVTAALLLAGTAGWLAFEWSHTLAGLPLPDKLSNALFQAITLRTAGFNSVDFAAISPATWVLCMVSMAVGGSPGSTAGGAKTTTLAVLALAVLAAIRGHSEVTVFRRRLPHAVVYQAAAIATVGAGVGTLALLALLVTQPIPLPQAAFEVVSALATVGLTMGATSQLDGIGKVIVIVCMFAGRVGPLTLFMVLVDGSRVQTRARAALERVHLG